MIALLELQALSGADTNGAAPLLCLAAGIVLALLAEIVPALRPARSLAFVGSLVAAGFFELRQLAEPSGVIFQGAFHATATTAFWGLLFCAAAFIAWGYSQRYYTLEAPHKAEHDLLMLSSTLGMMVMAGAGDLLTFFVGLELLSVPLYALAAFRRVRAESVEAGLRYFVLGAFAAGLFLYGTALLYTATGTFSLDGLRSAQLDSPLALLGVALVAASLFFKVSVFPFHFWVPDVYQGSPTPVTTFMATGTKAAGFAFLLNVAFLLPPSAASLIGGVAVITMALGNLGALVQANLKRLFAYSAIAHAGTLLLVVASTLAGDPRATGPMDAALYYMAAYVFTAGGAFGLIALMEADGERFLQLDSLGGFPATGGFLGKYFVFSSTLRADMVWVSVLGVLLSVVALGYYLRVILTMWMLPAEEGDQGPQTRRLGASLLTGLCAAMVLCLGLFPGWFLEHLL